MTLRHSGITDLKVSQVKTTPMCLSPWVVVVEFHLLASVGTSLDELPDIEKTVFIYKELKNNEVF